MTLWPLEDKRVLVLKGGIAVVVGYEHPPGCYVAYLKYVEGEGPWRGYERKVKEYSPSAVSWAKAIYDYNFNSFVPVVCADEVLSAPDPLERMEEILASPRDRLEEKAIEVYELLRDEAVEKIGVGGSLLIRIHHDRSDVDALIYDNEPYDVWSTLNSSDTLNSDVEWIMNVSKRTGLSVDVVKRLYSKALRARVGGTPVSFSFLKREFERYGSSASVPIGTFEGRLVFTEDPRRTLYYPHRREAGSIILESYETAFLRPMVECSEVEVRGTLYMRPDGTKVLRVGTKELMGYVLPAPSCR